MFRYLKTFFYPEAIIYSYKQPRELIIAKIHEILEASQYKPFWTINNDFNGSFEDEDIFYIKTIWRGYMRGKIQYSAKLIA